MKDPDLDNMESDSKFMAEARLNFPKPYGFSGRSAGMLVFLPITTLLLVFTTPTVDGQNPAWP